MGSLGILANATMYEREYMSYKFEPSPNSIYHIFGCLKLRSTGKELAKSISETLHVLLDPSRYNRQIRPGFGKKQVNVTLNLSVLGIGPVDEMTQVGKEIH